MILKDQNKPFSNAYFKSLFNHNDIDWAAIYMLPRLVTHNTLLQPFQYKILNHALFLNEKLHIFRIKSYPLCSFFNLYKGNTFSHVFYECDRVKCLWLDIVQCFQNTNTLVLPTLTPDTANIGILDSVSSKSFFEK